MPRRRRVDDVEWTPDSERRGNVRQPSRYIQLGSTDDSSSADTTDSSVVVHEISTDSGNTTPNSGWSEAELSELYESVPQPVPATRWPTWPDGPYSAQETSFESVEVLSPRGVSVPPSGVIEISSDTSEEETSDDESVLQPLLTPTRSQPVGASPTVPYTFEAEYFHPASMGYNQEGFDSGSSTPVGEASQEPIEDLYGQPFVDDDSDGHGGFTASGLWSHFSEEQEMEALWRQFETELHTSDSLTPGEALATELSRWITYDLDSHVEIGSGLETDQNPAEKEADVTPARGSTRLTPRMRTMVPPRATMPCRDCGMPGHFTFACPNGKASSSGGASVASRDMWCTVCSQRGHCAVACPARRPADRRRATARATRTCRACGGVGHGAYTCPIVPIEQTTIARRIWCPICGERGHTTATCPVYQSAVADRAEAVGVKKETSTSDDDDATN